MSWSANDFANLLNKGNGVTILNGDLSAAPSGTAAARIQNLEHAMQSTVFERCKMIAALYPEYWLVFPVPNDMVRPDQLLDGGPFRTGWFPLSGVDLGVWHQMYSSTGFRSRSGS